MEGMISNQDAHVLIIDDENDICVLLQEFISLWGIKSESINEPLSAIDRIREIHFDVCLLDVCLEDINGLHLIPKISAACPGVKIIIMTGHADKEVAVQALKLGAFDFLEKPFQPELLRHALCRALEALEAERKLKKYVEDLKASQADLLSHKDRLEFVNEQILDTNKALSVLARNIEQERADTEKRIALKIKSLVIPSIEKLARDQKLANYKPVLDLLIHQIEDLTTGFSIDSKIFSALSFSEMRVASMVKNGMTTEQIAGTLNISFSTVRTHRKNIRKKLKINNASYSLRNFLLSKSRGKSSSLGWD